MLQPGEISFFADFGFETRLLAVFLFKIVEANVTCIHPFGVTAFRAPGVENIYFR